MTLIELPMSGRVAERAQSESRTAGRRRSRLRARVGILQCRLTHRAISHPIHGKYKCWTCHREFPVAW